MNFNNIIMNPPYSKNLHLKILAKAIEKLAKNGTCVCLHPAVWEQQMAKEGHISIPITSYDIIEQDVFRKIFSLRKEADGCITVIKNGDTSNTIKSSLSNLIRKFTSHDKYERVVDHATKIPNTNYPIRVMFGGSADPYGACLTTSKFESAIKTNICTNIMFVNFDNEMTQKNFFNSISKSKAMKFLVYKSNRRNVCPWMGDCINPRTGKKGYKSEWTDEDFYTYFGITEDEQKIIKKTMEKYK